MTCARTYYGSFYIRPAFSVMYYLKLMLAISLVLTSSCCTVKFICEVEMASAASLLDYWMPCFKNSSLKKTCGSFSER